MITKERQGGNAWFVSARHYPTDDVEVVALKLGPDDRFKGGGGAARVNTSKDDMDATTLRKSQARAATAVRRKAMAMCADRMLTLTFRENVEDPDEAWNCFKYFSRLMRWRFVERWVYIAVQERQARGAIHFHLAIKGYFPVSTVREFWRRAAGHREGNIDIAASKSRIGKSTWNPRRIAQYLAKYMSKVDIAGFNKRRYSTGGGIQLPEPVRGWLACGLSMYSVLSEVVRSKSRLQVATFRDGEAFWPFYYVSTA